MTPNSDAPIRSDIEPGYIELYRSGELERRAEALEARLSACDICPRACGVNRREGEAGFCAAGWRPIVASVCAHHGEEPAISGSRGSGTIFFSHCNMRCVYCQNHQISQEYQRSKEIDTRALAEHMLYLQTALGCHNINLVSPSHFVPQIVQAILAAVPLGLSLPLVYNTSSYDSLPTLRELDGIVSIYLADLRYSADEPAERFSQAPDYVARAREAIREMYRQVGNLVTDGAGVARRGLIVRLLALPNGLSGTEASLAWLAGEVSPRLAVSIMSQYYPAHRAHQYPELARRLSPAEYAAITGTAARLGMENGWLQGMDAPDSYQPDFDAEGDPFALKEDAER